MSGRTLAIGDIHGCATALAALLIVVRPTVEDTVVLLGDLVDKGPDSRGVLEQILELRARIGQLVFVRGNHDEHLVWAIERWRQGINEWQGIEQFATFQSYGGVANVPEEHVALLRSAVAYYETTGQVFVHANLEHNLPLDQQPASALRYRYLSPDAQPRNCGRRVICGHLPQATGVPWILNGWVCIDTGAFRGGWLTCLDTGTDQLWQANESGETRGGNLDSIGRRSEW